MIRINAITTRVEPTFKIRRAISGTEHPFLDGGTGYDVTKVKYVVELNFSYLTQTEFNQIEALLHAEGNAPDIVVTLILNERIFDGVTVDPIVNRVLEKMKILNPDEEPTRPYEDDNTVRALKLILKET